MALMLISYDLDKPGQNYAAVTAKMDEIGAYRVLFSQWVWEGNASAQDVYNAIAPVFDSSDRVLITQVSAWWGRNLMKNPPTQF